MLLAHTDVVPAPPEGWTVDPFEGARARRPAGRPRRRRHEERARGAGGRVRRAGALGDDARRATWSWSPRPTRSATSPTSACRGWCASAPTCAATSRSTRAAACCSSSPTGAAWRRSRSARRWSPRCACGCSARGGHASMPDRRRQPARPRGDGDRAAARAPAPSCASRRGWRRRSPALGAPAGDDAALVAWAAAENAALGRLVSARLADDGRPDRGARLRARRT